jgi:hypothetical protein
MAQRISLLTDSPDELDIAGMVPMASVSDSSLRLSRLQTFRTYARISHFLSLATYMYDSCLDKMI